MTYMEKSLKIVDKIGRKKEIVGKGGKLIEQNLKKNYDMEEMKGNEISTSFREDYQKDLKTKLKNVNCLKEYMRQNNALDEKLELQDYLESGGESNVYSVHIKFRNNPKETKKKKFIMKVIIHNKREREYKREAIINAKLKNKGIIEFLGYSKIKEDESSYMILEEAKFGNLRNFQRNILKRPYLSESMLCYISYQVLSGLLYCHRCKIAHMDVKLQNIVVDEFLNFKLIDFSVSLNYQNKDLNDKVKLPFRGTNFYIPLEVLKSETIKFRDLNKIDLYSLGCVLYNLAFGRYAYGLSHGDEKDYDVIKKKVEEGELIFDKEAGLSEYFLDFLSKLLEKDINKRINIFEAMNHYWIKGANLLMQEKEKNYNISIFTSYLLTDHIECFNQYVKH